MTSLHGLVLAAGAGSRYGGPKALARTPDGVPWLHLAVATLRADDDDRPVTVVLGAALAEVPLPADVAVVVADDWAEGMGASLRSGLAAVGTADADAVLVTMVDLPDVGPAVVRRLLASGPVGPDTLARAAYAGRPGHPVLLGRAHLAGVRLAATGDQGARDYLATHDCRLVECGDLASGRDVDTR